MSYDIYLQHHETGEPVALPQHAPTGGTYALGGTTNAWLNVTYNYSGHFYRTMGEKGIRELYGKTGADSLPLLDAAIAQLGTDYSEDYWEATEGNARRALVNLREMAALRPDGVWGGD